MLDKSVVETSVTTPPPTATPDEPPFSVFTPWQKRWILFLTALAGLFSPMSSFIFYPAITSIATGLDVPVGLVNLAVTTYMAVSGLAPAILGSAADAVGRRPVYLLALAVYFVANLGLALQRSFPALLALRMLQSADSSGTIALGYGVIADIKSPAERGSYVGIFSIGPNVAPPLGPVVGGAIAANLGWRWIFWSLAIFGGACVLVILVALPETARSVVGNGSIPPQRLNRMLLSYLPKKKGHDQGAEGIFIVLLCNGLNYATYSSVQASVSTLFIETYGYNELEAGLVYLPFGFGCLASVYLWARTARSQSGISVERARETKEDDFPIEFARLRSLFYPVAISAIGIVGYGWAVQRRAHLSVPLLMQAIVGSAMTAVFVANVSYQALGTLLTDLNTGRSSTAAASANWVRWELAVGSLDGIHHLCDAVGPGWCFTFSGLLSGVCGLLLLVELRVGHRWRKLRLIMLFNVVVHMEI
ncbi:major facilitator superfamily transporter [Xylariomycetidae sp. FL0641]|nr:major facilitator superfamily transporter [Xylariomycetidae sp. FL0641]